MSVISARHLSKHYGPLKALDGLDLSVAEGEMLALLGHNGAGKTTFMKLLLGLTRPTAGQVDLLGAPPGPRHRRDIGFLPENVSFVGGMTGRQILRFYARLKGAAAGQVGDLLDRVGLAAAAGKPVRTYSKGMRQRLGLAQALLARPRLLLLDEPTSGLDPVLRRAFYAILGDLRETGTTVLISSHVLTELELRAERVAILSRGRLVACDTLAGLRRRAALPVRFRAVAGGVERRLEAPADEKMATLRRLAAEPLDDLEIAPPSLEDIYAHFSALDGREAAP
jgi:Cu-processing system ATP-binding protein